MTLGEEVTGRVVLSAYAQGDTVVLEFEHGALVVIGGFAEWQASMAAVLPVAAVDLLALEGEGAPGAITVDKLGGTWEITRGGPLVWWKPLWLSQAWFTARHPMDAARMWWGWRQ